MSLRRAIDDQISGGKLVQLGNELLETPLVLLPLGGRSVEMNKTIFCILGIEKFLCQPRLLDSGLESKAKKENKHLLPRTM